MPAVPFDPDPLGLISAFLQGDSARCGDAERVFVAWLVSLEPTVDPAAAAAALLPEVLPRGPASERLVDLLRRTTHWPSTAVAALAAAGPSLPEVRQQ